MADVGAADAGRRWGLRLAVLAGLAAVVAVLRLTIFAPSPVEVRVVAIERGRVESTLTNSKAGTVRGASPLAPHRRDRRPRDRDRSPRRRARRGRHGAGTPQRHQPARAARPGCAWRRGRGLAQRGGLLAPRPRAPDARPHPEAGRERHRVRGRPRRAPVLLRCRARRMPGRGRRARERARAGPHRRRPSSPRR